MGDTADLGSVAIWYGGSSPLVGNFWFSGATGRHVRLRI